MFIKKHFLDANHVTQEGKRSRTNGQGEWKKTGYGPLFSVNQTFGMFRDKVSWLTRRSWNLSKKIACLDDHLAIYVESHNRAVWDSMEKKRLKKLAQLRCSLQRSLSVGTQADIEIN